MRHIYNPEKIYRRLKPKYPNYILFIKNKEQCITYDIDSRILYYLTRFSTNNKTFSIRREEFPILKELLNENHLNVILAGRTKIKEYYSKDFNEYLFLKRKSRTW